MLLRLTMTLVLALAGPMACTAGEDEPATTYREGEHYEVLSQPVRTRNPDKIEVVEVFWYGCSHCFHFEPMVTQWAKQQPGYVDFWQSPAMWNQTMQTHARLFYTAKALGVLDKVHEDIYEAINMQRKTLVERGDIEAFFVQHGVSAEDFNKAFDSFGVTSQVKQADARQRGYGIRGTPEMFVQGKYRITTGMAGGQREMLKVVDYLVAKEHKQRAGSE